MDNLGEFAQIFEDETRARPFSGANTNVNLTNRTMVGTMDVDNDRAKVGLNVTSLDTLVEHKEGSRLQGLGKHAAFRVMDLLISKLQSSGVKAFERVGIRVWIIAEGGPFSFDAVRSYIKGYVSPFESVTAANFGKTEDIGATIESVRDDGANLRMHLGPYRQAERDRYFSLEQGPAEGVIFDIDLWHKRLEVPGFRASEFVRTNCKIAGAVVEGIADNIDRALT